MTPYTRSAAPARPGALCAVLALLAALLPGMPAGAETLRLNTPFGLPISAADGTGFFDRLMAEAFARHDLAVSIQAPPAERALMNANAGIDDGDGPRIHDLDTQSAYPNLLRVPEPLLDVDFVAFSNTLALPLAGWESLRPYNVGIVRGWKILERNIVGTHSLAMTKTPRLLLGLLANRRADLVVIDRFSGLAIGRALGMADLRVLEPPLATRPMYLYLHRKHRALVPRLGATLRAMKADGSYARIRRETLGPYLPGQGG